jgi:hypothetical protein
MPIPNSDFTHTYKTEDRPANKALSTEDEDDLAEIDPSNIIQTGRRTRGNKIDYATAAQNAMADDDDDEEDDDDFTAPEAEDDDAMDTK